MSFALASIELNGDACAAIRLDGRYWPLAAAAGHLGIEGVSTNLAEVFKAWTGNSANLRRIAEAVSSGQVPREISHDERETELVLPLQYPRKVFCVGANYADHLAEMGGGMEKVAGRAPFFYMKPPSTALTGPGRTVHIPPGCSNFDWEVEVVVVFGQGGRNIPLELALDCVAGYTLGIDFTSRDQFEAPHIPFKFDMVLGKCQDRTAPVGPAIVPKEFVDGENLNFRLSVNGIPKQDASTANMIYSLAEQISGISKAVRIEAGDILFTGSPAGVGAPRGERLKIGDKVVVEADVIGRMEVVIQPPLNASTTQS